MPRQEERRGQIAFKISQDGKDRIDALVLEATVAAKRRVGRSEVLRQLVEEALASRERATPTVPVQASVPEPVIRAKPVPADHKHRAAVKTGTDRTGPRVLFRYLCACGHDMGWR